MNISMKLASGPSVTVQAWKFGQAAACMSNYLGLLQSLRSLQADPAHGQETQALAEAVAKDAGLNPDDLQASDLAPLLDVIHELNAVEDMLGKPVALLVRCLTALQRAQEPEPEESPQSEPGTPPS
jgi:hypothetical protein